MKGSPLAERAARIVLTSKKNFTVSAGELHISLSSQRVFVIAPPGKDHFDLVRTATGKSGTLGGFTVVGVCCPWVSSLTRSET